MTTVKGLVSYDVKVTCPHCKYLLNLNGWPYTSEDHECSHAEDYLGLAVFGTEKEPAIWSKLNIEYQCYLCHGKFSLNELEI